MLLCMELVRGREHAGGGCSVMSKQPMFTRFNRFAQNTSEQQHEHSYNVFERCRWLTGP